MTVVVGPKQTEYRILKALLVQHSEYFKRALNGPWKEAEDGAVKLEDVADRTCMLSEAVRHAGEELTLPSRRFRGLVVRTEAARVR